MNEYFSNDGKVKVRKRGARIVEVARLQAKKILFDAINVNLDSAFEVIKEGLRSDAKSTEYNVAVQKMIVTAKKNLGPKIKVSVS